MGGVIKTARSTCGSAGMWLHPADISIFATIDHIELAGAAIREHERWGIAQIHKHHRVGYARLRDIDPGLRNDNRRVPAAFFGLGRAAGKDRVTSVFDIALHSLVDLMLLEAIAVAPQLL